MTNGITIDTMELEHRGRALTLSYLMRGAAEDAIVYLHGLGSCKHDARLLAELAELQDRTLLSFDFPGCGRSPYDPALHLTVEDLASLVIAVVDRMDLGAFALIGHSLGGAAAVLVAARRPGQVKLLISIEGNLAAADCFISRDSAALRFDDFLATRFLNRLEERFQRSGVAGDRIFADTFRALVEPSAFHDYTRSLTELSASGRLMERFQGLQIPRCFVHGSFNAELPYLAQLRASGVRIVEARDSGHWPMYDQPSAFGRLLCQLLGSTQGL